MAGDHKPIRVTPTHAGPDSKGIVSVFGWDLEGMVAFYLVGGALAGMLTIFALSGRPLSTRLLVGAIPLIASGVWVKFFIHARPPAYQRDVWESWLRGSCFRLKPQKWSRRMPPRHALVLRLEAQKDDHG